MISSGIPTAGQERECQSMKEAEDDLRVSFYILTEQLAECVVSLLGLGFPSSSEGHNGGCRGCWSVEGVKAEMLRQAKGEQGTEARNDPCLYTVHLSPRHSFACDDTRERLQLKVMSTSGFKGGGNKRQMGVYGVHR